MKLQSIEQDNSSITGRAGLTLINEMARVSGLNQILEDNPTAKSPIIRDEDILRTLCGLIAQGQTDFDHVRNLYVILNP